MSLTFSLTFDLRPFQQQLAALTGAALAARKRAALAQGAAYLGGEIQRGTPVDTGKLRGSLFTKVYGSERAEVGYPTSVPYGIVVEEGSKPHLITPRNARVLAFSVGGKRVFARRVNHPGTRAVHMVRNAVEQNREKVADIMRRVIFG